MTIGTGYTCQGGQCHTPQFHPCSVLSNSLQGILGIYMARKHLCFCKYLPDLLTHQPELFYMLRKKGFLQQELLLQDLLGKKGTCYLLLHHKIHTGSQGPGRNQKVVKAWFQNNQREKWDTTYRSEWKGWSTLSFAPMTHVGWGHAGTSLVILL